MYARTQIFRYAIDRCFPLLHRPQDARPALVADRYGCQVDWLHLAHRRSRRHHGLIARFSAISAGRSAIAFSAFAASRAFRAFSSASWS
jgi:hypothetical protein